MTYRYPKTLIWARKKFCYYDHPNVVIVDLPTIVSQKSFFWKFTKWLKGTLGRLFWLKKIFWLWSADYSDSWFPDYGGSKMILSKIHQIAYWYPKTLIWARKKFCYYHHPNVVIVDLPTIVSQKWFFWKFTKWLMGTRRRLF